MESELPFGYAHRREKRSAAHMDLGDSASPTWSHIDRLSASREPSEPLTLTSAAFQLPRTNEMPSETPRRFQGDGYDFRRPVVSATNVIDLTDEDAGPSIAPQQPPRSSRRAARPPRFGREIIDVEEEAPSEAAEPPDSPEIEFVSSRPIDPLRLRNSTFTPLADDDEDEVEFVSENPLPESRRRRTIMDLLDDPEYRARVPHIRELEEQRRGMGGLRSQGERNRRTGQMSRLERVLTDGRGRRPPRTLTTRRVSLGPGRHIHIGFVQPTLNFGAVGFDLGYEDAPPEAPPPPTYDPPPQAPESFTRSPQEEDVLVCPNCEDELCVGDSDQKRQVWLVKSCGHVYCGECMMNRHIKKSSKGKEKQAVRTKPFKECVVDGCQKKVSSKSTVIQVFL